VNRRFASAILATCVAAAPDLLAATDPLHPALRDCAVLKASAERLACYDRVVARLAAGVEAISASSSAEQMFGMADGLPQEDRSENAKRREQLSSITARVQSLRTLEDRTLLIELDNGQLWRQRSSDVTLALREGDEVTISRAALGTFRLTTPARRFARVNRVR
jgi:hypothetical protein